MRYIIVVLFALNVAQSASGEYVTVNLRPVANYKFHYTNLPTGRQTYHGIPFDLLGPIENNTWCAEAGTKGGNAIVQTMVLPVKISGATEVNTLMNTIQGVADSTSVSLS